MKNIEIIKVSREECESQLSCPLYSQTECLEHYEKNNGDCIARFDYYYYVWSDKKISQLKQENKKLRDRMKYKDLDIEMYIGALSLIKKYVDEKQKLKSWQKLDEVEK